MANWTNEPQPFGANRAPLLAGVSENDGVTPVPVAVDPATGRLLVNATGGSAATSVAINDGVTTTRKATVAALTDSNPLAAMIVDGNGDQITSFGGGTQYTDAGTPPAHPVGPTLEWNDAGTWATTGSAAPLPVTANAGTNLNTSLLATSANLTAGTQKTQVVDGSGNVIASTSNALNVAITAGTAVIGHVVTDSGSVTNATLQAGSALVGKVGIDQTTPGTTNAVYVTQAGAAAAMADGTANPTLGGLQSYGMIYNGATWERMRGDLGDASGATGLLVNSSLLYNGSTYDRARGDTTNGQWVNVKATVAPNSTSATVYTGQTTVSTSQVQLSGSSHALTNGLIIKAPSTNSAAIYIGLTGVATNTGDILEPGESRGYAISNTNLLYIISAASTSDIVSFSGN